MADSIMNNVGTEHDVDVNSRLLLDECVAAAKNTFQLVLDDCEGISVAADFVAFSERFDTGFGDHDRIKASENAVGVTPETLRRGKLGSHVILPKKITDQLLSAPGSRARAEARYTVLHELAHAHEHRIRATYFAQQTVALHQKPDALAVARRAIWSEYYVCRKVAQADPSLTRTLEESLTQSTDEFGNDCATARMRLRATNNPDKYMGT